MAYISASESSTVPGVDDSGKHSPASPTFHGVALESGAVDAWMDVASKGEAANSSSGRGVCHESHRTSPLLEAEVVGIRF
jgi:hypothetical protein